MSDLQGRIALVTGASRNIGRGIAVRLAEAGCDLSIAAGSNAEGLAETAELARAHGVEVHTHIGDLGSAAGCQALAAAARAHHGRVDLLVHTVAVRPHQPFETLPETAWEQVRSLILDSAFHLSRALIPGMLEAGYGRVVYFGGHGAWQGAPERAHVSAAKMGLVGLMRGLATEYGNRNIRFNMVAPGNIDTRRANPEWYGDSGPPKAEGMALQRLGTVQEMADSVHFLLSDAGGYVTGHVLHANGGSGYYS